MTWEKTIQRWRGGQTKGCRDIAAQLGGRWGGSKSSVLSGLSVRVCSESQCPCGGPIKVQTKKLLPRWNPRASQGWWRIVINRHTETNKPHSLAGLNWLHRPSNQREAEKRMFFWKTNWLNKLIGLGPQFSQQKRPLWPGNYSCGTFVIILAHRQSLNQYLSK